MSGLFRPIGLMHLMKIMAWNGMARMVTQLSVKPFMDGFYQFRIIG